jgi:hypothetical protein
MKGKNKVLRTGLMATLLLGAFGLPLLAQHGETGRKAVIGLSSETRAGDLVLPSGTYQVQHVVGHTVVFRKMIRDVYGRGQIAGKEVGRVPCDADELGEKIERTETFTVTDQAGNTRLTELRIKGETVRHLF